MGSSIRVAVAVGLVVACLDGQARVADRCITTLGAMPHSSTPAPTEAGTPRTGCPVAIGYARSSGARGPSMPSRAAPSAPVVAGSTRSLDV